MIKFKRLSDGGLISWPLGKPSDGRSVEMVNRHL